MTNEKRLEIAKLLAGIQTSTGQIALLLLEEEDESPALDALGDELEPLNTLTATDDPATCGHPEEVIRSFVTGQRMCMSCGEPNVPVR